MTRILVAGWFAMACASSSAAVTTTMIDLPIAGGPRILDIRPDNAVATIVSVPGGAGVYGITGNAVPSTLTGQCGPIARNGSAFAANGFAVVLVDRQDADIAAILGWLWNRDHLPLWITGASSATTVVATLGGSIPGTIPLGVQFTAPATVTPTQAQAIARPTQIVYHTEDALSNATAPDLYNHLENAPAREIVAFSGGISGGECNGYHLLVGLDTDYVAAVTAFIAKWNGTLHGASGPAAVEYFNAGFGHYFMTADGDEIAGLDGGAYGGAFVRTGRQFNVFAAPGTGTVPVCRFFTTPGHFGTRSSHFYTADPVECEGVKTYPDWQYEKIAFHVGVPAAGACPGGTTPVYRMFNNGQTGAPNHRFTTDLALYQQFTTTLNWSAEGIAFCAPP